MYPEEFRRKVLDLVAAGRPAAQVAADLDIGDQTIYAWRKQELIDTGQAQGITRGEQTELAAARQRIREVETQVAILARARDLLQEPHSRNGGSLPSGAMAAEGLPVPPACRLLSSARSRMLRRAHPAALPSTLFGMPG